MFDSVSYLLLLFYSRRQYWIKLKEINQFSMSFSQFSLFLASVASFINPITANFHKPSCKAVPGSPDWPSTQSWAKLNSSVSGQLIKTIPPGSVCHPSQPNFNALSCAAVQAGWLTVKYHYEDPVSSDWNNVNNDTCLPLPVFPCSGAGYPIYVVNATTKEQVKKGVDFARENNVRLIVKGTGHDYQGR